MSTSILDPIQHAGLLRSINDYAEQANVPVEMIHQGAGNLLTPEEKEWLKNFDNFPKKNAILQSATSFSIVRKMQAIACVFLRNEVDARVLTVGQLVADREEIPNPTVLLIPNLYVTMSGGKAGLPAWQITMLYDLLVHRMARNRATIVYVENMDGLATTYGAFFADLLKNYNQVGNPANAV